MIIGVDKNDNIISVETYPDINEYSIKIVSPQDIDLSRYNYKYINGKVENLGLKREFTMTKKQKILEELSNLDTTINRATEDLYTLTDTTPYKSIQEVITRKEELREELKKISEGEM